MINGSLPSQLPAVAVPIIHVTSETNSQLSTTRICAWLHELTALSQHELRKSITAANDTDVVIKTIRQRAMLDLRTMLPQHQNQQQPHYQYQHWQS